jgi:hypothetical protein
MSLCQLSTDRRRLHAAELVLSAWRTRQVKSNLSPCPLTPAFVTNIETKVADLTRNASNEAPALSPPKVDPELPNDFRSLDNDDLFDLDFQDVDWGFWDSIG